MLKKNYRSLSASEVSELFDRRAETVVNRYFRINWKKSERSYSQFAVVIPRKILPHAVNRNKMRRILNELIRVHFSRWTDGLRVAILVRTPALHAQRTEFRNAFLELMSKSHLK
ncbi:MAG: ribonuclease P protein component [bacterium]|nr:ribonuclease P protein component [bacterium]